MLQPYEPFSAVVRDDPYPYYAELRAAAPVYWAPEAQAWCVSRHDDVQHVLRSPEEFSSDAMRTMLIGARPGVDPLSDPESMRRMMALAQAFPFPIEELATARNLISEDAPRHGPLRQVVNRGFTPRRIAVWEERAQVIARDCVAGLGRGEPFDVVADLAIPLPVQIIAEMIGVEGDRFEDFKRWSDDLIATTTGSARTADPLSSGFVSSISTLLTYVQGVVEARRERPGDDLISVLIAAQGAEGGLSAAEVANFVMLLLVAGNETTTNLIGNATLALLRHPDQLDRVRADRRLVPALVEETLRWDAPVQFVFRRSTCDVELAGTRIPASSYVVPLIGSANRDERQWGPTAARFDIGRNPQGHLAFGFGNHFCLGASLARLEARIALDALLDELPRFALAESPLEYVDSFLVRGPRRLPLHRSA